MNVSFENVPGSNLCFGNSVLAMCFNLPIWQELMGRLEEGEEERPISHQLMQLWNSSLTGPIPTELGLLTDLGRDFRQVP